MKNAWIKRHVQRQLFTMPVSLNSDYEIEFEEVTGKQIPKLIRFWRRHAKLGSITREAYVTIAAIILYSFERESGVILEADTL